MTDDVRPTPLEQDPAIYLRQQPSPTSPCHLLVEQLGSHLGDHVPMHMLAKVAVRVHQQADWRALWDGREKVARRLGRIVIGAAIANVAAVGAYWLHAHDARVAAEERAAASEREAAQYRRTQDDKVEQLRLDVRELRAMLRRMSGLSPETTSEDPYAKPPVPHPDRVSDQGPVGGASTPASTLGSNGLEALQLPKEQNGHLFPNPLLHSKLLLQVLPHPRFGSASGMRSCSGAWTGAAGGPDFCDGPQASASSVTTKATLNMITLYPWLHHVWKGIEP